MRVHFICKRYYTNKDLLKDRFGRLYQLPLELAHREENVDVAAIDYRNTTIEELRESGLAFRSIPASSFLNILALPFILYRNALAAKPDIIIASGDSHIGFLAFLIARILQIPFVFDVYDYYPVFRGNRIPGMKSMFYAAVKGADLVLCASTSLGAKMSISNNKTLVVENGVDTTIFHPIDMREARDVLGLVIDGLYIGYFGTIDASRGPILIEAVEKMRKERPELKLLLAGEVKDIVLSESWIIHYGNVPQSQIPSLINACDVVTIPYARTPFNDYCGACKIAEYLACCRPVVATRVSDHACTFADAPFSLCEPTPESMAEALRWQLLGRECVAFPQHLSWEAIGAKLHNSLQTLL
jgi:glycosyltransferase involved in cell wall biosynthesis